MNIPNVLTLCRILLVPVMVIFVIQGRFCEALIVFCAAGVTDALDGFLARIMDQKTVIGAYLDPLADKALVASSFIVLSVLEAIPDWLTVIVISRDLIILVGISVLFFMSVSFDIRPLYMSKATTVLQFSAVFGALLSLCSPGRHPEGIFVTVFWLTAVMTIVSGFVYIAQGVHLLRRSGKQV